MKLAVLVLALCLSASSALACSVSREGDYLIASGDPLLPVLWHAGKFFQCSSVFDPVQGQVLDCGHGSKPMRNPESGGVLWGTVLFKHTDKCPALPPSLRNE